ncbi:Lamina-associated polypeptide 2, isoforms beta/delta/epsilon/gamma [Channa argus]|uniref:Lamina-associated polypeptide 2, isoforms beta/delta/epsilon/gamma n=1 Tax=Channa argus TaxID=215402 RepID=A0A6G1QAD1_CHAAH|nr:Lamina-associated polypeptide 2, isoforms beta/delta/epsilon/gamma [Channa argus]
MPEYLDDPSVLTKDKLKSELLAHNVSLPSGNPAKDVYVQLYLKNLTAQNKKNVADTTLDAFSSDEELPPPVVSNRNRSFGRKATRKTDRIQPDEVDVTVLTDQGLRDELLKHGVDVGPIVASSRKLYERKLQKLLDDGPARPPLPQLVLTEIQGNHNINCESELYSDKEDEVTSVTVPEPVVEPEPVPVVERAVRSRGKTPVTSRHHSTQPQMVEKIAAGDQTSKLNESDILKELVPNDINSPTRLIATCRQPIKGAAGRPVKSSDLWNDENSLFSPKHIKTSGSSSSYTERLSRLTSLPSGTPSTSSFSSSSTSSRLLSATPPAVQTKAARHSVLLWIKLFLLAIVAAFLFLVYQAMETNTSAPFPDSEVAIGSTV